LIVLAVEVMERIAVPVYYYLTWFIGDGQSWFPFLGPPLEEATREAEASKKEKEAEQAGHGKRWFGSFVDKSTP
jgi:hypothetical protein